MQNKEDVISINSPYHLKPNPNSSLFIHNNYSQASNMLTGTYKPSSHLHNICLFFNKLFQELERSLL